MRASQISIGRFHHFHLARQLEKRGQLDAIYTGYPRFKLKDEEGIPEDKIHVFPWLQAPFMARGKIGLDKWDWLDREWAWQANETLDLYVSKKLSEPTILIALSGSGLHAGRRVKELGGVHICDRGSSHIRMQEQLLNEEYQRYGICWSGIDSRGAAKEEAEYEQSSWISVPSQFCVDSFTAQGVPADKIIKIPYGSRLERFSPLHFKSSDNDEYRILFVGAASVRKGFIDLLSAFQQFRHPKKRLILVGSVTKEAKMLLDKFDHSLVTVAGFVPNIKLKEIYSKAKVFVLPSIEEGLAMVIGEAMACGCPVIASTNTGASELIDDGVEGFIVPIRSPMLIADRLQQFADQPDLHQRMSQNCLARVKRLGGWDNYGSQWSNFISQISLL
jgi:glycosyltransferase involved in cell wall biosynthesis